MLTSAIQRSHQTKNEGLHQKYKERHPVVKSKVKKTIRYKIKDVELIANDKAIMSNSLLLKYINKILRAEGKKKQIEHYIWLIDAIPGYEVEYDFSDIKTIDGVKQVNLLLQITKIRAEITFDTSNHGAKEIGRHQFVANGQIFSPFGWNDSYSLSINTSNKLESLLMVTGNYEKHLNSYGTKLSFLASFLEDDAFRFRGLIDTKSDTSSVFKGAIEQPLFLSSTGGLSVGIGLERREVDNYSINATKISAYDYVKGNIFMVGRQVDFFKGENELTSSFYHTVNRVNLDILAPGERKFDRNFSYFTLDYYRNQPLSHFSNNKFFRNINFLTHITATYSNDLLPVEDQFFIGGANAGKGYEAGYISTDKGVMFYNELRYDWKVKNKLINVMQPYAFYETSYFSRPFLNIDKNSLPSIGGGLRILLFYNIIMDLEVASPLKKNVVVNDIHRKNSTRFNFLIFKKLEF